MGELRIAYDYLFNYFGKGILNGKQVNGATITLNIRPYKDGQEVLFEDNKEPAAFKCGIGGYTATFSNIYNVYFDNDKGYVIVRNEEVAQLFMDSFEWDRIEAEVIGYSLDIVIGTTGEVFDDIDLPDDIKGMPVSEPEDVKKEVFMTFLEMYKDDFDISDNKPAQVPSVLYYEPDYKEGSKV